MKFLLFVVAVLIIAAGAIWSGIYNISALDPHWEPTMQLIGLVRDRSIAAHSDDAKLPPLDDPKLLTNGAAEYRHMCRVCHGAPGASPDVLAQGLYPAPADLLSGYIQKKWNDNQLYWIIENGIKMTGMPAFSITHEREELVGLVAFLKRLPGMTPEEYRSVAGKSGEGDDHGEDHEH
ncbi:MAG: cytochrome c [Syntrophobacteraceae bacterium]